MLKMINYIMFTAQFCACNPEVWSLFVQMSRWAALLQSVVCIHHVLEACQLMLFPTWQCVQAKDKFNPKPIRQSIEGSQLKAIFITFASIGLPHTYAGRCLIKLSVKLWSHIQMNHAGLETTPWVCNYRELCFDKDFFPKLHHLRPHVLFILALSNRLIAINQV